MKKNLSITILTYLLFNCLFVLKSTAQTPDCSTVNGLTITATTGQIVMQGQAGTDYFFKINDLDAGWAEVFGCSWQCGSSQTATGLPNHNLLVSIFDSNWSKLCEQTIDMNNLGGGSNCIDNDNDNICADADCDDNDNKIGGKRTVGEFCDDGDPNTFNDKILADGCTCAGESMDDCDCPMYWTEKTTIPTGIYTDRRTMVNNDLYSKKVIVQTDVFADYVFEEDYDLMPLSKLEQFIDNNQHLPNIPKGETIIKDGLDVGELSVLQMEKIEEMTLYILQINKRLAQLEKENKQLKKALKNW